MINDEVVCRKMKASDKQELAKMYCELNRETFFWMPENSFSEDDFDKDTFGEIVIVAVASNTLLGFISILEKDNLIHQLYISSKSQGLGIGKKLLNEIINMVSKRPIILHCRTRNMKALSFYKKNGFKIVEEIEKSNDTYFKLELN